MREKTVCFTGHRIIPSEKRASLFAHLTDVITSLLEAGYRYFGAGGALGFDTLAAQAVLQLRTEYPQIRLILVLPCKEQTRGWLAADVDTQAAFPAALLVGKQPPTLWLDVPVPLYPDC